MTANTADFELGTVGANVSVADPGSLTPWFSVTIGGGGAIAYASDHVAHGSKSVKYIGAGSSGAGNLTWGWTQLAELWGRFYIYPAATPSTATDRPFNAFDHLGGHACGIQWDGSSRMTIIDKNFITVATIATGCPLNQWARVEFHFNVTTGAASVSMYESMDSTTATDSASCIGANFSTDIQSGHIEMSDIGSSQVVYFDQICHAATAAVGPFPVSAVAPVVSGSAPVGSLLTCDGGSWNGTFALGFQWTRDGANIGGANSSTYATQSADVGHGIGCVTTATGMQATNESASQASSNTITVTAGVPQSLVPHGVSRLNR